MANNKVSVILSDKLIDQIQKVADKYELNVSATMRLLLSEGISSMIEQGRLSRSGV